VLIAVQFSKLVEASMTLVRPGYSGQGKSKLPKGDRSRPRSTANLTNTSAS